MRFLLHGGVSKDVAKALVKHEHVGHSMEELAAASEGIDLSQIDGLFRALSKKQWELITTDAETVRKMYEDKILFAGVVVLLLPEVEDAKEGIDRLFERYKRLTPKRMYTVTESRVKVRQLPGAV